MSENDSRAELFTAFQDLSDIVPEMRAGQLMAAVGELCADLHGRKKQCLILGQPGTANSPTVIQ